MRNLSDDVQKLKIRKKEELEKSLNSNIAHIVIEGKLAEDFQKTQVLETVDTSVLSALAAGIPRNQFSDRPSIFKILNLSISTGLGVGVVNAITSIGIARVMEIYRDYDVEVEKTEKRIRVKMTKI